MQKTTYLCDQCSKVFGDKKHISLSFGNFSGIANPPKRPNLLNEDLLNEGGYKNNWIIKPSVQGKFLHFCNGKCIGEYFKRLMK